MQQPREKKNRIMVHDVDALVDLINTANEEDAASHSQPYSNFETVYENTTVTRKSSPLSKSFNFSSKFMLTKEQEQNKSLQMKQKKEQRQMEYKNYLDKAKRENERLRKTRQKEQEERFVTMYNSLVTDSKHFVSDISKMLEREDLSEQRKREELYQQWCLQVFDPIQQRIASQLEDVPVQEIERRRREWFENFLQETNKKAGIFRDIIIEADYDPLESRKTVLKYKTNDLQDPTKKSKQKAVQEMEAQGKTKIEIKSSTLLTHKSREVLEITMWDKVEATPHGRYSNDHLKSKEPDENDMKRKAIYDSHVVMDHFNVPHGNNFMLKEQAKGLKTYPEMSKNLKSMDQLVNGIDVKKSILI